MALTRKLSSLTRLVVSGPRRCQSTASLLDKLGERLLPEEDAERVVVNEMVDQVGIPVKKKGIPNKIPPPDPTPEAHEKVSFLPAPLFLDKFAHLPASKHVGKVTGKKYLIPEDLERKMREVAFGHNLNELMLNNQVLLENLQKRKIPPEDEQIEELVDAQLMRMMLTKQLQSADQAAVLLHEDEKEKLKKQWAQSAKRRQNWTPILYPENRDCLMYMVGRFAADYAVIAQVFRELGKRFPRFSPSHILDFGSGLGSVVWAANRRWNETLVEHYCVDASPPMRDLALKLMQIEKVHDWRDGEDDFTIKKKNRFAGVYFRPTLPVTSKHYQLATCTFTLLDLPSAKRRLKTVDSLWLNLQPYGFLILVEDGTKHGYDVVQEAREYINEACRRAEKKFNVGPRNKEKKAALNYIRVRHRAYGRVKTVAPCPHNSPCPLYNFSAKKALCNTAVTYVPSVRQTQAHKPGKNPAKFKPEKEKIEYSFVILQKLPTDVERRAAVHYLMVADAQREMLRKREEDLESRRLWGLEDERKDESLDMRWKEERKEDLVAELNIDVAGHVSDGNELAGYNSNDDERFLRESDDEDGVFDYDNETNDLNCEKDDNDDDDNNDNNDDNNDNNDDNNVDDNDHPAKEDLFETWPRIIDDVHTDKGRVYTKLCLPNGAMRFKQFRKSDFELFHLSKRSWKGDLLPAVMMEEEMAMEREMEMAMARSRNRGRREEEEEEEEVFP